MRICILGGCGYIGTVLSKQLLEKNKVKIIDTQWFGNKLKKNKNLKVVKKDIRKIKLNDLRGYDILIHLANIANDPTVELSPTLSWEVNVLAMMNIAEIAVKAKIKKIIFASSGSVYGIKKEKKVTEELILKPISTYNKTKMIAERVLLSYSDKIKIYCVRPATVCGYSPKMRFDISVNMLTLQALKKKLITVFGGNQVRPNIHIQDLVNLFKHLIYKKVKPGIYNAGFENKKIIDVANQIKKIIPCKILITKSNDPRSYRQNSDKILRTGFRTKNNVKTAIIEIKKKYEENILKENINSYNLKKMKLLNLK